MDSDLYLHEVMMENFNSLRPGDTYMLVNLAITGSANSFLHALHPTIT